MPQKRIKVRIKPSCKSPTFQILLVVPCLENVERAYEFVRLENKQKQTSVNTLLDLCFYQVTL